MIDLSVNLGFCKLKNPILTASGTFGYGLEYEPFIDINELGGFVVKGLYFSERPGNPPPRLVETASGLINAIGLQGIGVRKFCAEILPRIKDYSAALFINVCGDSEDEYVSVVEYLDRHEGIDAYELNISCPNVKKGGTCPALCPEDTFSVTQLVKKTTSRPVVVKLSPNVTDISGIALSAQEAGADAISLVNTFLALAIDTETRTPKLANILGGLSGPAIKPLALRMVYQVASAVTVPVIGIGGIHSTEEALEYLIAGATAVQVGTANFIDPETPLAIIAGLEQYCVSHNIKSIEEIIGSLQVNQKK